MNKNRVIKEYVSSETVTYVMTNAFRVQQNHSLYYALSSYKRIKIIVFRVTEESAFQNHFFLQFKDDLIQILQQLTPDVLYTEEVNNILPFIEGDIVFDGAYLNEHKKVHQQIISSLNRESKYTQVETNVLVPVAYASPKEEYSAKTLRSKIHLKMSEFIDPVSIDVPYSKAEQVALHVLNDFIANKLPYYHLKNHPEYDYSSSLSPYLKYGFISPLSIYLALENVAHPNKDDFIEELIVRRELAYNFTFYNTHYDQFKHITYQWAYDTMDIHQFDHKEYIYTIEDYIAAKTHDIYFNTAMKEMIHLHKMHGYMRMYWCKKIIEWSRTYEEAYHIAITLNNRYFLDGNDPNGYTGVAWCFGKHDRAWKEREVFGKLRYMNANGLKRKFDIEGYVSRIEREIKK